MRLRPLKLILAIGAMFLGYFQIVTAAVAAPPAQAGVGAANSTHQPVVARDGGSDVEGGYYNHCTNAPTIGDFNGHITMNGWCGVPIRGSRLDLNGCYANINGDLFPVTDGKGDFCKTCKDCQISEEYVVNNGERPPSWMRCTCERFAGDKEGKVTLIDMNLHIHVVDNKLGCPGVEGEWMCNLAPDGICNPAPPPPL